MAGNTGAEPFDQQESDPSTPQAAAPDLARLKRYFSEAEQMTSEARSRALRAMDYFDSDQFTAAELARLRERGQPPIVINRIKPAINGVIGVTERGRADPRAWPRNPADSDSADVATDVLRYIADFNRFKRLKQDCFKDMLVPGTMAALVGADADLEVTVTQIRWEEFFHDPRARRPDFKDARYLGIAKWMYADDAEAIYPEKAREIDLTLSGGTSGGLATGGMATGAAFQDRPGTGVGAGGAWADPKMRRLLVVEIYYKQAGAWMRCVFTGSDILESGPSPYVDHRGRPDCPIEAMSAYVKQDNSRYGAVWDMIGPQDEINKRRSKSIHLLNVTRLQAVEASASDVDADVARAEAARPDGVIPYGWAIVNSVAEYQGNREMMAEAKGEIERMGPSPAMLGRNEHDDSGRALLARQQSGLTELANLYGALEDWELRVYRQMWSRAKQYWTAPRFIRVTDDENAPRFVGLNQTDGASASDAPGGPGEPGRPNNLAEMDVDIEIDSQAETGTVQQEAFQELMRLVGTSPAYQQQIPLATLIQLSPIPHKRGLLDTLNQAADAQAARAGQEAQMGQAMAEARLAELQARTREIQAKAPLHGATGFAKTLDALSYARSVGADPAAAKPPGPFDSPEAAQQSDAEQDLSTTGVI